MADKFITEDNIDPDETVIKEVNDPMDIPEIKAMADKDKDIEDMYDHLEEIDFLDDLICSVVGQMPPEGTPLDSDARNCLLINDQFRALKEYIINNEGAKNYREYYAKLDKELISIIAAITIWCVRNKAKPNIMALKEFSNQPIDYNM